MLCLVFYYQSSNQLGIANVRIANNSPNSNIVLIAIFSFNVVLKFIFVLFKGIYCLFPTNRCASLIRSVLQCIRKDTFAQTHPFLSCRQKVRYFLIFLKSHDAAQFIEVLSRFRIIRLLPRVAKTINSILP